MMSSSSKRHRADDQARCTKRQKLYVSNNHHILVSNVPPSKKRKYLDDVCESCLNNEHMRSSLCVGPLEAPVQSDSLHYEKVVNSRTFPCINAGCPSYLSASCRLNKVGSSSSDSTDCVVTFGADTSFKRRRLDQEESNMHLNLKFVPDAGSSVDKEPDMSPEFNSFNFWRPVLPDIEVPDMQLEPMDIDNGKTLEILEEGSNENPQFNSFNYWKMPVQDLGLELLSF